VYFLSPFFATVHIITFKYVFGQKFICFREQHFFWVGEEGKEADDESFNRKSVQGIVGVKVNQH
jgi:hypothetical protein